MVKKKERKQTGKMKKGQKLKVDGIYAVRNNLLQRMNSGRYRYVAVYKGKGNIMRR